MRGHYIDKQTKDKIKDLLLETYLTHDEIGAMFNLSRGPVFTIQKKSGIKRKRMKKGGLSCVCKYCSNIFWSTISIQKRNKGKFCSKECYRQWQMSDENKGSNHPNWKDGIKHEKEIHAIRHSPEWKQWRHYVFKRDNYKCQFCGSQNKIEPHHIYPRREYPELIFDTQNGITLCRQCHVLTINKECDFIGRCKIILQQED